MNMKWIVSAVAVLLTFSAVSNAWASRDPLGGGLWIDRDPEQNMHNMSLNINLYEYVANNPIDNIDPLVA